MLYRFIHCTSRDHNKCEVMNGHVSLAVSISRHFSVKTNYEEFLNLKRIEKKIKKSSVKLIIGFDREDMK